MAPILGIWASGAQPAANATSFESIATVSVGSGGAADVEFTSIPADYTHLQLRVIGRTAKASGNDYAKLTFNNVGGTSYATHYLWGTGSSVQFHAFTSSSFIYLDFVTGTSQLSNSFSAYVLDILDYANTNKNKTVRWLGGQDLNGDGVIILQSGLFNNTAAISSIKLVPNSATNWLQYSHFALYGIKGAA